MATTAQPTPATPPVPTAEAYPVQRARLRGGRVFHRIKQPDNWADLVEAACGKTGYLTTGYPGSEPGQCRGCYPPATS